MCWQRHEKAPNQQDLTNSRTKYNYGGRGRCGPGLAGGLLGARYRRKTAAQRWSRIEANIEE
jgi:hypothetical protein